MWVEFKKKLQASKNTSKGKKLLYLFAILFILGFALYFLVFSKKPNYPQLAKRNSTSKNKHSIVLEDSLINDINSNQYNGDKSRRSQDLLTLGYSYYYKSDYSGTIDVLRKMEKEASSDKVPYEAYELLAMSYEKTKDVNTAKIYFDKAYDVVEKSGFIDKDSILNRISEERK